MVKVGLIGCGFMGGMHSACWEALAPMDVKVVAVADPRNDYAKKLAGDHAVIYTTGMELIEKADVDVVDICLPTDLHVSHAVAAMKAGKNVFVEKPICMKEEEMELILKTEKETGAKVQVGQCVRHWTEFKWLKKVTAAGTYGKLQSAVFKRLSSRPGWASDNWLSDLSRSGGVAVDMHVHDVDFVRYLLGEPDRVQAQAFRDANGAIQQIMALYGYGNDVAVSVEACWDYPDTFPFTAEYRVKFEKATAELKNGTLLVYLEDGTAPFTPEMDPEYEGENDIGGNLSSLGGYYNELEYYLNGLAGKNDLSIATVDEAVKSVKLVKKEIEAAGGLIRK